MSEYIESIKPLISSPGGILVSIFSSLLFLLIPYGSMVFFIKEIFKEMGIKYKKWALYTMPIPVIIGAPLILVPFNPFQHGNLIIFVLITVFGSLIVFFGTEKAKTLKKLAAIFAYFLASIIVIPLSFFMAFVIALTTAYMVNEIQGTF